MSFSLICEFELLKTSAEFVHGTGGHVFELEELLFSHTSSSKVVLVLSACYHTEQLQGKTFYSFM